MQCHSVKNAQNISIENFIQKGQYGSQNKT